MPRRNRGFEAFELPRVRDLAADDEELRLLQYGEGIEDELIAPNPRRRGGMPPSFGRSMERPSMLDQPDSSNVGRSIELSAATPADSTSLLELKGADESCKQLTIGLALETLAANTPHDLAALVTWGSGGYQAPRAEIDIINGVQFSVAASFLRVLVRSDTGLAGLARVRIGAWIGYGSRPGGRAPQRTLKTGALAIAATVDLTIPTYAIDASLLRSPSTCDVLLRYLNGAGAVISEVFVPAGAELEGRRVPIPNDAVTLRVVNGGVALDAGRLVFGLSV